MIKLLSIVLAILLFAAPTAASEPAPDSQRETPEITFLQEAAAIAAENSCLQINGEIPQELSIAQGGCCKVCRKGKACGNSCISRSYNCTRPRGCACDG